MEELRHMSNGLEALFEYEKGKCSGILNGIDTKVWDPEVDTYLQHHYNSEDADTGNWQIKRSCVKYLVGN
jgi:starch synthase